MRTDILPRPSEKWDTGSYPPGGYWWFGLCVKTHNFESGPVVPMLHTLLWREYTRCLAIRPVITKCGTGVGP